MAQMFVNYAHRGASAYLPENTFSSFFLGLRMQAGGIETDVRRTKDGVLVLFHDGVLDRVTNATGDIHDYTWDELARVEVTGPKDDGMPCDRMVPLSDFLRYFAFRPVCFAAQLKDEGIEREVAEMLRRHHMREKTVVTSFGFDNLRRMHEAAPEFHLGWLVQTVDDRTIADFRQIGGYQLCPPADSVTAPLVASLHRLHFSVRAWGVKDEEKMCHAFAAGVDGMTVNFPDRLHALQNSVGQSV